jgi:hypothetical protein
MKLADLEKYREEDGYINIDKAIEENPYLTEDILREFRGNQNREKDWIELEDTKILLRTEDTQFQDIIYASYAELLAEEVAKQIEFPHAHYDLIKYKGQKGVLSQSVVDKDSESLISGYTLLKNLDAYKSDEEQMGFVNIEDIIESFDYLNKYDNFDKKDIEKLTLQLLKITYFDIFSLNPDRNVYNYSITYNAKKREINLSDIYDNEKSFGGCLDLKIISSIASEKNLATMSGNFMLSVFETPENYNSDIESDWKNISPREEDSDKLPFNWQVLLLYLEDNFVSEELTDFYNRCYKNIDISKAFDEVEKRIKAKVPEEYKKAANYLYEERKLYIRDALCLGEDLEYEDRNSLE